MNSVDFVIKDGFDEYQARALLRLFREGTDLVSFCLDYDYHNDLVDELVGESRMALLQQVIRGIIEISKLEEIAGE